MSKKRFLTLLLSLFVLVGATGCGATGTVATPSDSATASATESASAEATPAASSEAAAPESANPFAEKMVISTCTIDAEKAGKSPLDEYFNKKFNVEYQFIPVTWGDWKEKVRAWVAADDMPDVLWWDMKIQDTGEFKTWAESGAFKALPDDLSTYPNLKAWYDKMQSPKAMLTVNGKLVGWPATRNNPEWVRDTYQGCATYRRDWAKAVGLYKEGDIYTFDEVKALIKAVQEKDPGNNGKGQTIPLSFEAWAFPGTLMEGVAFQEPRDPYIKDANGKWIPSWSTADYKEEVKFVTDLYRTGYVWKDQMMVQGSEGSDKFRAGSVFMHWGNSNSGWSTDNYDIMLKNGIIKDIDAIGPMLVLSAKDNKTFWLTQTEDYWTVSNFNHKVDDAKMTRVLAMWDWLMSEEGRSFQAFGVPDKDFTANGDGTYNVLWAKDANNVLQNPYPDDQVSKFHFRQAGWRGDFPELARKDTDILMGQLMNFQLNNPDFRRHDMNWDLRTFGGENFKKLGNYGSDINDKIKALCGGKEDVDKAWDAVVAEYLPKCQPVIDELTAAFP